MPPTTIHVQPQLDSFTSLEDHQSHTPETFYDGKPVLHYHSATITALGDRDQIAKLPFFSSTDGELEGENALHEEVAAFISSENATIFNPNTNIGLSIPYPAISLHAIQRLADPRNPSTQVQGLYMQLELLDPHAVSDDDEPNVVELTLIPPMTGETSDIQKLFDAVSNCSNLHPDPAFEGDEEEDYDDRIVFEGSVGYEGISGLPGVQRGAADGGLPPPFPGSGGWITAENVSDYFDADGNWIGGGTGEESLGDGAGRIRTRQEMDGVNGDGNHESDDNKRPRTD
ncbi:hypothetical protein BDZ45DRAFT_604104 [Acephala macrosclerotiorum]|nr:hypothetical protein BDZ45DRAFT_604104 [Acephala macrosclerotiorum]